MSGGGDRNREMLTLSLSPGPGRLMGKEVSAKVL